MIVIRLLNLSLALESVEMSLGFVYSQMRHEVVISSIYEKCKVIYQMRLTRLKTVGLVLESSTLVLDFQNLLPDFWYWLYLLVDLVLWRRSWFVLIMKV